MNKKKSIYILVGLKLVILIVLFLNLVQYSQRVKSFNFNEIPAPAAELGHLVIYVSFLISFDVVIFGYFYWCETGRLKGRHYYDKKDLITMVNIVYFDSRFKRLMNRALLKLFVLISFTLIIVLLQKKLETYDQALYVALISDIKETSFDVFIISRYVYGFDIVFDFIVLGIQKIRYKKKEKRKCLKKNLSSQKS